MIFFSANPTYAANNNSAKARNNCGLPDTPYTSNFKFPTLKPEIMRPAKLTFLIILFFSPALFLSCSSDDNSPANEQLNCNNSADFISASIDGNSFCSIGVIVIPTGFEVFDSNSYMIQGMNQDQELLIISIGNEPGTYEIPGTVAAGAYTPDAINEINYLTHEESPASGTLIIEEISGERVKGSFEFSAYRVDAESGEVLQDHVSVTNGTFDVAIPINN